MESEVRGLLEITPGGNVQGATYLGLQVGNRVSRPSSNRADSLCSSGTTILLSPGTGDFRWCQGQPVGTTAEWSDRKTQEAKAAVMKQGKDCLDSKPSFQVESGKNSGPSFRSFLGLRAKTWRRPTDHDTVDTQKSNNSVVHLKEVVPAKVVQRIAGA
ncbi:hypothetical protein B0H19DRAFT_1229305 [Mycena capillaripes]|nr:hypothetical protein B0H19DRAFT_1229305 [Mycena capillaripes]